MRPKPQDMRARNIFAGRGVWPKTWSDFAFWEACFMGISERHPTLAAADPFRPGEDHHTPARSSVSR